MKWYLIPKGTPVLPYKIDGVDIWANKHLVAYEAHPSNQNAFIDIDDSRHQRNTPQNGPYYIVAVTTKTHKVVFAVEEKFLIKI